MAFTCLNNQSLCLALRMKLKGSILREHTDQEGLQRSYSSEVCLRYVGSWEAIGSGVGWESLLEKRIVKLNFEDLVQVWELRGREAQGKRNDTSPEKTCWDNPFSQRFSAVSRFSLGTFWLVGRNWAGRGCWHLVDPGRQCCWRVSTGQLYSKGSPGPTC